MEKPNILIDSLPETVEVNGREFFVNTGFRTAILFEMLMLDDSVEPQEKTLQALRLFFPEVPSDVNAAIDAIIWFYSCGKFQSVEEAGESERKQKRESFDSRSYDFDADAAYIYAAFLDQYGIDLNEIDDLHWWKFHALFTALKSDNEICRIMEYRSIDLSKIKDKKERARLANLKARFALPSAMTKEQKAAVAGAVFAGR